MKTNDKVKFKSVFAYKVIYIFTVNDNKHKNLIKIGDTTLHTDTALDSLFPNSTELNQVALSRIKGYTNTAGVTPILLHTELAVKTAKVNDGTIKLLAFRDHEVHKVLENSGIKRAKIDESTGREWYQINKETALEAINAVKKNYANLSNSVSNDYIPIIFRQEQDEAINLTIKQFEKSDRMLWNAKMRFGKTLSALEVIKQCAYKKTIIITHRPVVNDGWYEDFTKIFYGTNYLYASKTNGYTVDNLLKENKNFVYFTSIQDLRGSEAIGGKFEKNKTIFDTVWDCVIVDEAHEGTKTALGDDTIKAILKEELQKTKLLALSGTPFNIINEYDDGSIYTWDYIMEQECKSGWDNKYFGDSNPYDELPELRIYTYDLGDILHNSNYITYEDKAFNFHEFFRTWTGDYKFDYAQMPNTANIGDFIHEQDIWSFLNLMTKEDENSAYPYSKKEYRELFKHSLWMVPGIREAKALKNLMTRHPVFSNGQFDIVNIAGSNDEESFNALNSVRNAINTAEKLDRYTITLSCGKLTTGVTVKEWTGIFMLSGSFSTSAANYLQTIFRVQSPCNKNGKIKKAGYVFDFAPDRTLKMVSEAISISSKAGKTKDSDKKILGKFLNYCPVISVAGSQMTEYKVDNLLQQLKKVYADKVVRNGFDDTHLYNDELLKLGEIDIKIFEKLKGILGRSNAIQKQKNININNQGLTNEEYEESETLSKKSRRELTEAEKLRLEELKKKKEVRIYAISILRCISIRMPLLIYGADIPYDEEITLNRFVEKVDDSSWKEFMPTDVTKETFGKFRKYYDEDVFIAAGRRIRNIAREADTLNPTDRTKKIAGLFSNFKNPDKETVLTPWRVVNIHMSDTLGGYDFYDEKHENTLEEPRFMDQGQVTSETFSNEKAQILEINSKTGLYPLYVAYSIYRARCKNYPEADLTLDVQQKLWNDTIQQNVFVICKTPMAKQITQRTLAGYSDVKINAHYFDDLINIIKNKPDQFRKRVLRGNFWGKGANDMKFDAVVGNPPYQDATTVNNRLGAIYPYFYNTAEQLSNKYSLISPARFLFNTGLTPKKWNEKMLANPHLKVVRFEEDATKIFQNTDIKGGVSIIYYDKNIDFGAIGEFIPNDKLRFLAKRFKNIQDKFSSIVFSGRSDLKFTDLFIKNYPQSINDRLVAIKKLHSNVTSLSPNEEYELKSSTFEILPYVFKDTAPLDIENYYKILGRVSGKRCYRWIEKKYMVPRYPSNNINSYKVLIPESNGAGLFGETLSTPLVIKPSESSTPTFISIGNFKTNIEASHVLKYLKTKFTRTLLGIRKKTQHNPAPTWEYVPLQDFTSASDIDWNKSVSDIDKQLYTKYGLSDDEIAFIEEKIIPMR
ncbi:MAG: Eco57I restriction-modification methylase domain-containing protein [Synergistaceae bacterium]